MRTGKNPLRGKYAEKMPPVVAAVITHLPNLIGYHVDRLEVVQTCLTTMRENAGTYVPVYVWDNGSGIELRDWLINDYRPEFLMLSPNVGKSSARSAILRLFPPETIVGISDDDMYFYPDWLGRHIELLEGFPNVGAVSGWPVRTAFNWGIETTFEWAKKNADEFKMGRFISNEEDRDYCNSIGRDYEWHRDVHSRDNFDFIIEYKGLQAYATAHHCQFIGYAGRLAKLAQWSAKAMPNEKPFDVAIDKAGLLRLTTVDRLTRHIGNVLDEDFKVQELNIEEAVMV